MINNRKYTDKEIDIILKNLVIIIDKRDKPDKNTHITDWLSYKNRASYERVTLSNGDYSCMIKAIPELDIPHDLYFDKEFVIERKANLEELSGNFTTKRTQFENELATYDGKMQIVIEDTWSRLFQGTYNTKYGRKSFIGTVMAFTHRYDVTFHMLKKEEIATYIYTQCRYFARERLK